MANEPSNQIVKFRPPPGAEGTPDTGSYNGGYRYKGGFLIPSSSGSRNYKISFDLAQLCWTCSCPGCISHGQCKHLSSAGLKGRALMGKMEGKKEALKFGFVKEP
jgi:hypothetical protein